MTRHSGRTAGAVGLVAALLLLVWVVLQPSPAVGAGWLIGLSFWLAVAVGAWVLLAIHVLTGGRWGTLAKPVLHPAAASIPLFLLLGLPVLFALSSLYPWASTRGAAPADVAALYLNPTGWTLRAAVALAGWSLFAWLMRRHATPLIAALGLCFHGVVVTLIGTDWVQSLAPRFYSTVSGATLAVLQILAALAWITVTRVLPAGGAGRAGDVGGLLLATALGSLYLGFCQYLVIWYGDNPDRVAWYVERLHGPWLWLDAAALVLCGLLPVFALMRQAWRNDPLVLARIGCAVLVGVFAHFIWLVAPGFGAAGFGAALLACLAIGGIWLGFAYGVLAPRMVSGDV